MRHRHERLTSEQREILFSRCSGTKPLRAEGPGRLAQLKEEEVIPTHLREVQDFGMAVCKDVVALIPVAPGDVILIPGIPPSSAGAILSPIHATLRRNVMAGAVPGVTV